VSEVSQDWSKSRRRRRVQQQRSWSSSVAAGSSAVGRDGPRSIRLFHSCVTKFRRRERNIKDARHKTRGPTHRRSPGFGSTTAADDGGQIHGVDEHGSRRNLAVGGRGSAAAVLVPWSGERAATAVVVTQERIHSLAVYLGYYLPAET